MANSGKYVTSAKDIDDHGARVAALMAIRPAAKPFCFFEVGDVAALLDVDAKTLQRKRALRDSLLAKGEEPDPLDISSIPYAPARPNIKYAAQDLEDFLKRLYAATRPRATHPASAPGRPKALAIMGFQSWMATASAVDVWPFSIQPDGRPMDLCAAIVAGKLSGKARRMTLREMADALAAAASKTFHDGQSKELDCAALPGKTKGAGSRLEEAL